MSTLNENLNITNNTNDKIDRVLARDKVADENNSNHHYSRTRVISGERNKGVYIKVNEELYTDFTNINRAKSATNNGMLNMLIAEYVRNNQSWLS